MTSITIATETRGETATRERWEADFAAVNAKIPADWLGTHDDGSMYFRDGHCTCDADGMEGFHCLVHLHLSLAQVGYAKGWL